MPIKKECTALHLRSNTFKSIERDGPVYFMKKFLNCKEYVGIILDIPNEFEIGIHEKSTWTGCIFDVKTEFCDCIYLHFQFSPCWMQKKPAKE